MHHSIRLPDRFYLSRVTREGAMVHDVVPWAGAVAYVTDGERYGVLMADGAVDWWDPGRLREELEADFLGSGVELEGVIAGVRAFLEDRLA